MLKSNIKIIFRNLSRNKFFSLVNIGGLTVGMSACIIIFLYVNHELSYDRFHVNGENIYRIRMDGYKGNNHVYKRARTFGFLGPKLETAYPEVQSACRMINLHGIMGNLVMSYGDKKFVEEKMYYADASFFDLFSFTLLEGDPAKALSKSHTAVITKSTAKKYFGNTSPLGKTMVMNEDELFKITGILEDPPENSHLKFSFLLSYETIQNETYMLGWADFLTYVLLDANVNPKLFENKLKSSNLIEENLGNEGIDFKLSLQPLYNIHLYSHLEGEAEVNGSAVTTYGLMLVAFFILIVAWINYVNLSTAHALDRAKEVGVRKVVGARRRNLVSQFVLESTILNFIALALSLLVVELLLPFFRDLTHSPLVFSSSNRSEIWAAFLALFIIGSLVSSIYPALVLSSFKPIKVLKNLPQIGTGKWTIRKTLIVAQFITSVILIVVTWAVFNQLSFMRNQELGINIDQTIIVKAPSISDDAYKNKLNNFKTELSRFSDIQSIAVSSNIPGRESTWGGDLRCLGDPPDATIDVDYTGIDYDFLDAYGLQIIAGRAFSKEFPSDKNAVLLNEIAAKMLGFEKPESAINEKVIAWRETPYQIIGVVQNHHQLSLRYRQNPIVYFLRPTNGNFYSIKTDTKQLANTINLIQREYQQFFPGNPFEYFFLDEYFAKQYQADQQFGRIFGLFAALTIFIACLGLFALTSYTATRKTKEIGIRKVFGATIPDVTVMLSRQFLRLVFIANLVALPVAGFVVKKWLENYAYRMELTWDLFVLPAVIVILVALMTVSTQAIRAALANPVESLRYE